MQLVELFPLARDTVADPKTALRRLIALKLDVPTLWLALAAVTAVGVVMAGSMRPLLDRSGMTEMFAFGDRPLVIAMVEFVMLALLAGVIFQGGRLFGGTASFAECLLAVVWLQFMLACLQVAQLLSLLILPVLAVILGWAGIVLFFWLLTSFIAEVHGFASRGKVLAAVFAAMILFAVIVVFVLALFGVTIPGASDV